MTCSTLKHFVLARENSPRACFEVAHSNQTKWRWGIRLPETEIIRQMGKPRARRLGMQLNRCRKFVCTISTVVEHDFLDHLIEPVGNTVTIMPSDLLRNEIGCDDGEKLLFVTLCQQVNDRCIDITIVQYL